jgi:hypothetical protein
MKRWVIAFVVAAAVLLHGAAGATTVVVDAKANIFGAGHAVPPDPGGGGAGLLPPCVSFTGGPGYTVLFSSVTGTVFCCNGEAGGNGPDGGIEASGDTDILPYGGISGIVHGQRTLFLVGVFLDDSEPVDPAPPRIDFTGWSGLFNELTPELRQVFFIGDGLADNAVPQVFYVPDGATRLYLGFADALHFGDPTSLPGYYDDNLGELTATLCILPYNPTPTSRATWGGIKALYR